MSTIQSQATFQFPKIMSWADETEAEEQEALKSMPTEMKKFNAKNSNEYSTPVISVTNKKKQKQQAKKY